MDDPRLSGDVLARDALDVAPDLLGCVLAVDSAEGRVSVRLTEVEAYRGPEDPASHAFRRTRRSEVMYGGAGHLYVYFTYGMHFCLNVVCGADGVASAVLLRAGEVVEGLDLARQRRVAARRDVDLARGPGRLAQAVALTTASSGLDLDADDAPVRLLRRAGAPGVVRTGPRVGVAAAADRPWRFWVEGDPTVSPYKRSPRAPSLPASGPAPAAALGPARQNGRRDRPRP